MRLSGLASVIGLRLGVGLAMMLVATPSLAYIDPNAGGLAYQILLPVLVAIAAGWRYLKLTIRALWQRIAARLTQPAQSSAADPATEAQSRPDDLP